MIALGCDHGGYELKQEVIKYLEKNQIAYRDYGCFDMQSVDYPIYARKVAKAIQSEECEKGILICGTGIGISIAANKCKGIRAALCSDCFSAEATRQHNDANVLSLPARFISVEKAQEIVKAYFAAEFEGGRHLRRVEKIACK